MLYIRYCFNVCCCLVTQLHDNIHSILDDAVKILIHMIISHTVNKISFKQSCAHRTPSNAVELKGNKLLRTNCSLQQTPMHHMIHLRQTQTNSYKKCSI